jgi:hypothetical protein
VTVNAEEGSSENNLTFVLSNHTTKLSNEQSLAFYSLNALSSLKINKIFIWSSKIIPHQIKTAVTSHTTAFLIL